MTLWELDPGAYAFWRASLTAPRQLKAKISEAEVSLLEFDRCRATLASLNGKPEDVVEAGYAFLFLNRTSYSGIVGAGPIGGRMQSSAYSIDCRFNRAALLAQIDNLAELQGKLSINFGDGIAAIASRDSDAVLYVDPPYFSNGRKFYRKFFTTLDHYRLRKALLSASGYWLLSYDYDKKVEYLYRELPSARVNLYHSARSAGSKEELLVSPLGFNHCLGELGNTMAMV